MKQGKETDIYVRFEHEVEGQLMNSHCHVAIAVLLASLPRSIALMSPRTISLYDISITYVVKITMHKEHIHKAYMDMKTSRNRRTKVQKLEREIMLLHDFRGLSNY